MSPEADATLNGSGFDIGGCVVGAGPGTSGRDEFFSPSYRTKPGSNRQGAQGAHLNPLGLLLKPLGLFLRTSIPFIRRVD
jgi:hypothetical protein